MLLRLVQQAVATDRVAGAQRLPRDVAWRAQAAPRLKIPQDTWPASSLDGLRVWGSSPGRPLDRENAPAVIGLALEAPRAAGTVGDKRLGQSRGAAGDLRATHA
jgi:hypothetical protein